MGERLSGLVDRLLHRLEEFWLGEPQHGPVVPRVKNLRTKILPEMVEDKLDEEERQRRWSQLADIYLSQQVASYPPDYIVEHPSIDRLLETVERYEEDLTDKATPHPDIHAIIDVGEAIEVSTKRDRSAETDPLMDQLREVLQGKLDELAKESPIWSPESSPAPEPISAV